MPNGDLNDPEFSTSPGTVKCISMKSYLFFFILRFKYTMNIGQIFFESKTSTVVIFSKLGAAYNVLI